VRLDATTVTTDLPARLSAAHRDLLIAGIRRLQAEILLKAPR
jgi:hypothetical protein